MSRCHRYPPQVVLDRDIDPDRDQFLSIFPEADAGDWCGEFEDIPKEPEPEALGREERSAGPRRYPQPNPRSGDPLF